MTGEDRKKIFCYLKRKTSYTAWKRQADIFHQFAGVFEKQVKEQPHAPGLMEGTDWKPFYPRVVKAQGLYDDALRRLLQGDGTIFLHDDRGAMVDATILSGHWYTELVNQGLRGDHTYDGKYVPFLTALMEEFSKACADSGYLQPMMADTPASELWSTFWYEEYARLDIPEDAPEVPDATDTVVRTGATVPVFGIYEPQIKDGCMNYLLGGTEAPTIWESDGTYATDRQLSVSWRLIWQDTRYEDGTVPDEESAYFRPLATITPPPLAHDYVDDIIAALTGETCVRAGTWGAMEYLNSKIQMRMEAFFPQYQGRDIIWIWLDT